MNTLFTAIIIGIGATLVMDLWGFLLLKIFKLKGLNYAFVGRWIGHFPKKVFRHKNIMAAKEIKNELLYGWLAHYTIGISFAYLLLLLEGTEWLLNPTILPALLIGLITVIAPFFMMQPAFGMGIAAAKTPTPNTNRIKSIGTHLVFGFGLYISAVLYSFIAY